MKLSEHWLRQWVNPEIETDALVAQLSMAGLEVDGVEKAAPEFSGVVVGEVLSVLPHPDADKLRVCQVTDGRETAAVVCGAPNVTAGMKAPWAKVGAVLPENFRIKKAKLRGVESFGMLCGPDELGVSEERFGLMELPASLETGADLRDALALDDTIIEIDLTPNRGDCLGVRGLAREIGVLNEAAVHELEIEPVPATIEDRFPISVFAPEGCPRYLGRVIKGVDVHAPTPDWMVERLRRAGLRSIDAIVDVTNYVMLELGQPMHAFDLAQLNGSIDVRLAQSGERLTLLDGSDVALDADTLMICDADGPVAMAGIMGGERSGIAFEGDAPTKDVFLECAFFSPVAIAGRARRHGLQTDASYRYERGSISSSSTSPQSAPRVCSLISSVVLRAPSKSGWTLQPCLSATRSRFARRDSRAFWGCTLARTSYRACSGASGFRLRRRKKRTQAACGPCRRRAFDSISSVRRT